MQRGSDEHGFLGLEPWAGIPLHPPPAKTESELERIQTCEPSSHTTERILNGPIYSSLPSLPRNRKMIAVPSFFPHLYNLIYYVGKGKLSSVDQTEVPPAFASYKPNSRHECCNEGPSLSFTTSIFAQRPSSGEEDSFLSSPITSKITCGFYPQSHSSRCVSVHILCSTFASPSLLTVGSSRG